MPITYGMNLAKSWGDSRWSGTVIMKAYTTHTEESEVFLSYRHADQSTALGLANDLDRQGRRVYIDVHDDTLVPGQQDLDNALVNAPYHRPVSTRHFRSDSKVTSTRLSEMRASCRAFWQSPSSSVQCFHWDRLYSAMSVGIGATVIVRVVAGLAAVGSWVGVDLAASVEEAGVGVAVAGVDSGVP